MTFGVAVKDATADWRLAKHLRRQTGNMFVTENLGLRAMGRDQQHTRSSTECRPTSWTNERGEVGAAVQYYGAAKFARLLQLKLTRPPTVP